MATRKKIVAQQEALLQSILERARKEVASGRTIQQALEGVFEVQRNWVVSLQERGHLGEQVFDVFLRQTARYPIAAWSDGMLFRNSLIAGFSTDVLSASALVVYLNSTPIRWLHYQSFRDARMGMPQVKVGHLRKIPRPTERTASLLHEVGEDISRCGQSLACYQDTIDSLVAKDFGLSKEDLSEMKQSLPLEKASEV